MSRSSFALIGEHLAHSMSPFIHKQLFKLSGREADYRLIEIESDKLESEFDLTASQLKGFNVTIPYKQRVIPLLKGLSGDAEFYGAVNCVDVKSGIGHNTDAYGFLKALEVSGIELSGKVLVLGNGGAARTVAFEAARAGCEVTIASRSDKGGLLGKEIARRLGCEMEVLRFSDIKGGYDLVVNATPVGMYPNVSASPLEYEQLEGCRALFDLIYNPCQTKLMRYALRRGMKVGGGMPMLVWQAARSHEIWYSAEFKPADIEGIVELADAEMAAQFSGPRSIVLCGFMGCGKSSVGKALAAKLGMEFVDTDALIVEREGKAISEIFASVGEEGFRQIEHEVCVEAAALKNAVIAVGGGAMTYERNVKAFEGCTRIFLDAAFDTVKARIGADKSRPLFDEGAVKLYNSRLPLYKRASDHTVDANGGIEETLERILDLL